MGAEKGGHLGLTICNNNHYASAKLENASYDVIYKDGGGGYNVGN